MDNLMTISLNGFSYLCDHHDHRLSNYIDMGVVLFPDVKGRFGIIRYGTEVMVFDIREFMQTEKIEKDDILWYKEFFYHEDAYNNVIKIFKELDDALNGIKDPTIRFPSIYNSLEDSEILQSSELLKIVRESFTSYGEGIIEGMADGAELLFDDKDLEE